MSAADERILAQRIAALEQANAIRSVRAAWIANLHTLTKPDAHRAAADLIDDPPEWAARWNVRYLLAHVPGVGPVLTARWTTGLPAPSVGPTRLEDLSDRERRSLATNLRIRADRLSS